MPAPDPKEVHNAVQQLWASIQVQGLVAYPASINGARVTVLGHLRDNPGNPELQATTPIMVIVNEALLPHIDITEAQT